MITRFQATERALDAVNIERDKQEHKWGMQRHAWPEWMCILSEEVGEAATLANWLHWPETGDGESNEAWLARLRLELIQVAAVAVAMIEQLDEELYPL